MDCFQLQSASTVGGCDNLVNAGLGWSRLELVQSVQNHVKSINFGYKVQLRSERVEYINARGRLLDAHSVEALTSTGEQRTLTADHILIAVGGRPSYPGGAHGC